MINQTEIHREVTSSEIFNRQDALDQLHNNFSEFPDKKQAWDDLIRLTKDEDSNVRWKAAEALGTT